MKFEEIEVFYDTMLKYLFQSIEIDFLSSVCIIGSHDVSIIVYNSLLVI